MFLSHIMVARPKNFSVKPEKSTTSVEMATYFWIFTTYFTVFDYIKITYFVEKSYMKFRPLVMINVLFYLDIPEEALKDSSHFVTATRTRERGFTSPVLIRK